MKALCEVFAYGCYVQGFYNADPHPGAYARLDKCLYASYGPPTQTSNPSPPPSP